MNAVCREDLEDDNMSAGIAMSRKTKTPPVSKLTSGCRPREVRHASSMARCALSLRLSPYVDSAKAASSSELDSVAPAESTHGS